MPNPSYSNESWLQGVSCPSPRACIAVGFAGFGNGNAKKPLVERWDGRSWALQRAPSPSGANEPDLQSISCSSPNACTAVGDDVRDRAGVTLAERWDGHTWSIQNTANPITQGTPAGSGDWFYRVSCPAASACTAVGGAGGFQSSITLAERWDGRRWTVQHTQHPKPNHASNLSGVSCPAPAACTAVGSYDNWHGPGVPLAERYN